MMWYDCNSCGKRKFTSWSKKNGPVKCARCCRLEREGRLEQKSP